MPVQKQTSDTQEQVRQTLHTAIDRTLSLTSFQQREYGRYHHSYNEELEQYELLRDGDMKSVEIGSRLFCSPANGSLSDDPLRDKQFLFCCAATLATRFAIEGGMENQTAYNLSDLYIRRADKCSSPQEVFALHREMFADFTRRMNHIITARRLATYHDKKGVNYTKPVQDSLEYIYYHLNERITIQDLAEYVGISGNYLSRLFHDETGHTIHDYIRRRKVETAKNMLLYSSYSLSDIGEFLCFSSASHFIKTFREITGMTPKEYKDRNYSTHENWAMKSPL